MEYFVCFIGGILVAAVVILGGWFGHVVSLRRRAEELSQREELLRRSLLEVQKSEAEVREATEDLESRRVSYTQLENESRILKQDLFNFSVQIRKMDRDHAALTRQQEAIDQRSQELAQRYLAENVSWIASSLNPNNYATCRKRMQSVIDSCRAIGYDVPETQESSLVANLKEQYERVVRAEFQRQEQARIRAQIREEEKIAREAERQIRQAEQEQAAIEQAIEMALARAKGEYSAEVENLKARLKEAQEKTQRAKSQAEMTRSGHVYVISNIGAFGENVFKIGMSRRLEPMDRVRELGGASVPFPFDVHVMISSDDAPALENALHRELHKLRLNKVNLRKEFFRVDVDTIRRIVEEHYGTVDFVSEPEAQQYRESVGMSDEDYEFIEQTMESIAGDGESSLADE